MGAGSFLRELISAKNGNPPDGGANGGAGGGTFTEGGGGTDDGNGGARDSGTGGGAEGSGGGGGASVDGGGGVVGGVSSELGARKWVSFLGREGGILGAFFAAADANGSLGGTSAAGNGVDTEGSGGADDGGGGANDGRGGADEGRGGAVLGMGGGTSGDFAIGRFTGTGIDGAGGVEGGLPPASTFFNFGTPPAKISPNCGAPRGIGGAPVDGGLGMDGAPPIVMPVGASVLPSIIGFSLSTVVAFFNRAPLRISPKSASRPAITRAAGLGAEPPPSAGGGGGGGGGGGPAIMINRCENRW